MPQVVAAVVAKSAMAAPVAAAATTAATAAGSTAAIEAAKQAAIQAAMKQQAAQLAAQQATQSAVTQQAAQTGIQQAGTAAASQAAQQASVEAAKQGIFSGGGAGMPPPTGAPIPPASPLPPAGSNLAASTPSGGSSGGYGITSDMPANAAPEILPAKPGMSLEEAQALNSQLSSANAIPNQIDMTSRGIASSPVSKQPPMPSNFAQGNAFGPSTPSSNFTPNNLTDAQIAEKTAKAFEAANEAAKNPLEKGFDMALKYVNKGLDYAEKNPLPTGMALMTVGQAMNKPKPPEKKQYKSTVDMSKFKVEAPRAQPFERSYEWQNVYAGGGPVEQMSAMNAVGDNSMYPQAQTQSASYSNPTIQRPMPSNVIRQGLDAPVGTYTGEQRMASGGISAADAKKYGLKNSKQRALEELQSAGTKMQREREQTMAEVKHRGDTFNEGIIRRSRIQELSSPLEAAKKEFAMLAKKNKVPVAEMAKTNLGDIEAYMETPVEAAQGGIMSGLGGYSDGGRLLRGPGDGVSDSIPAVIGNRQPARLADGEFVIPARIVSELGNGSTEAGARKLYAMMDRIQKTRKKSIGKKKVAVNSKADKHLPA